MELEARAYTALKRVSKGDRREVEQLRLRGGTSSFLGCDFLGRRSEYSILNVRVSA
jgi:hypothetical protein